MLIWSNNVRSGDADNMEARLLGIPVIDVSIDGHRSPLMIAATTTTTSLYRCFSGVSRKILYPEL